jgi:hypothetical protein
MAAAAIATVATATTLDLVPMARTMARQLSSEWNATGIDQQLPSNVKCSSRHLENVRGVQSVYCIELVTRGVELSTFHTFVHNMSQTLLRVSQQLPGDCIVSPPRLLTDKRATFLQLKIFLV